MAKKWSVPVRTLRVPEAAFFTNALAQWQRVWPSASPQDTSHTVFLVSQASFSLRLFSASQCPSAEFGPEFILATGREQTRAASSFGSPIVAAEC